MRDLVADPTCYEARVALARLYLDGGDPARAAAEYETSLTYHPEDAHALYGLGRARAALGEFATAHQALEQARALRPGDAAIEEALQSLRLDQRWRRIRPILVGALALAAGIGTYLAQKRLRRSSP